MKMQVADAAQLRRCVAEKTTKIAMARRVIDYHKAQYWVWFMQAGVSSAEGRYSGGGEGPHTLKGSVRWAEIKRAREAQAPYADREQSLLRELRSDGLDPWAFDL